MAVDDLDAVPGAGALPLEVADRPDVHAREPPDVRGNRLLLLGRERRVAAQPPVAVCIHGALDHDGKRAARAQAQRVRPELGGKLAERRLGGVVVLLERDLLRRREVAGGLPHQRPVVLQVDEVRRADVARVVRPSTVGRRAQGGGGPVPNACVVEEHHARIRGDGHRPAGRYHRLDSRRRTGSHGALPQRASLRLGRQHEVVCRARVLAAVVAIADAGAVAHHGLHGTLEHLDVDARSYLGEVLRHVGTRVAGGGLHARAAPRDRLDPLVVTSVQERVAHELARAHEPHDVAAGRTRGVGTLVPLPRASGLARQQQVHDVEHQLDGQLGKGALGAARVRALVCVASQLQRVDESPMEGASVVVQAALLDVGGLGVDAAAADGVGEQRGRVVHSPLSRPRVRAVRWRT